MAVTVRLLPAGQQRKRVTGVSAQVVRPSHADRGQEQQGQQQCPAAVAILVMPPTVVGREILGQRRFQRIYQPGLVGGGQEQQIPGALDRPVIFARLIFPPPLGN